MHTRTHEKHRKKHTKTTRGSEYKVSTIYHASELDLLSCKKCQFGPTSLHRIRLHLVEEHYDRREVYGDDEKWKTFVTQMEHVPRV